MRDLGLLPVVAADARSSWARYNADAMYALLMDEGSGSDLSEVNGEFDTAAYSGTTTNLWANPAHGVTFAGDGGYIIQSPRLVEMFDFNKIGRWVISMDLTIIGDDSDFATTEFMFALGAENTGTGQAGNGGGILQVALYRASSAVGLQVRYRDGDDEDASGSYTLQAATQTLNATLVNPESDGTTNKRVHVALRVWNGGGGDFHIQAWINGALTNVPEMALDGTRRMYLKSNTCAAIGAAVARNTTLRASNYAGVNAGSGTKMRNLVLWYSSTAREIETIRLINDLYRNPGKPSRFF